MKEDADWITRIIDNQNEERRFAITITYNELRRINMKNKSAVKDGVLCILAANNPVDFNNGQSVNSTIQTHPVLMQKKITISSRILVIRILG